MASWQFIFVGVLAAVVLSSAKDCTYEGKTYADGSKFKIPELSGNCVEYTCKNGGFSATTEECELDGVCHPIGTESVKNCFKKVCEKNDQGIGFITKELKCSMGGSCYALGHEDVQNCVRKVCEQNAEGAVGFFIKDIKCENDGECIETNTEFSATVDGVVYGKSICTVSDDGLVMYQYRQ